MIYENVNKFDIYGSSMYRDGDEEPSTQVASGTDALNMGSNAGITISWVGILVALVAIRILYEVS